MIPLVVVGVHREADDAADHDEPEHDYEGDGDVSSSCRRDQRCPSASIPQLSQTRNGTSVTGNFTVVPATENDPMLFARRRISIRRLSAPQAGQGGIVGATSVVRSDSTGRGWEESPDTITPGRAEPHWERGCLVGTDILSPSSWPPSSIPCWPTPAGRGGRLAGVGYAARFRGCALPITSSRSRQRIAGNDTSTSATLRPEWELAGMGLDKGPQLVLGDDTRPW